MKKIILSVLMASTLSTFAASTTPLFREDPLLNGWNLAVTNATTYGPGQTNNLFTTINGQVVYSLTNQTVNGASNTNIIAGDAFDTMGSALPTDANGQKVANCVVHVIMNNTNFIPIVASNSIGQWFTTNWLLSPSQTPNWMYPATTNYYYALGAHATNTVQVFMQGGWTYSIGLGKSLVVWDVNTNLFQFTVNPAAIFPTPGTNTVGTLATNLPTAFTQQYNRIRVAGIVVGANVSGLGDNEIINQISIGAPQP